jgi:hypothetical protein
MNAEGMQEQSIAIQQKLVLLNRLKGAVSWFNIIAVLSVVNSLVYFFGGQMTFVVGLGLTQTADGLIESLPMIREDLAPLFFTASILAYVVSFVMFVIAAMLAKKDKRIYMAAMVLYALDGVIMLIVQDWFSAGFHAFALFRLFVGFRTFGELEKLEGGKEAIASQPVNLLSWNLSSLAGLLTTTFWSSAVVWLLLYMGALWLFLG